MQSKRMSRIEALSNTTGAFIISTFLNMWMLGEFFNLDIAVHESLAMVAAFTLVRSDKELPVQTFFQLVGVCTWKIK